MLLRLLRRLLRRETAAPTGEQADPVAWRAAMEQARNRLAEPAADTDTLDPTAEQVDTGHWRYNALCDAFQNLLFDELPAMEARLTAVEQQVLQEVRTRLTRTPPGDLLPRLPDALHQLLRELTDEEASARRVEGLIRRDPALAGDVIRLANSAWFRRRAKPITSIEQAVPIIGRDGLRDLVTALLMQPVLKIKPTCFRLFGRTLWEHSLTCAQSAARVAARLGQNDATAYFLGLVHNVGRIALFHLLVDAFARVRPGLKPRSLLFRRLIDEQGYPLAAAIVESWGVDPALPEALREQPQAAEPDSVEGLSPLGQVLFLANLISTAELLLREERRSPEQVEACLVDYGLSLRHLSDLHFAEPEP